jgi:hypothetical protein
VPAGTAMGPVVALPFWTAAVAKKLPPWQAPLPKMKETEPSVTIAPLSLTVATVALNVTGPG